MTKKICYILISAAVAITMIFAMASCSHIGSINSTLDKLADGNYTLEVHSELLQGAVDSVRKYDGEKLYLQYGSEELYFDKIGERYVERYTRLGDKWVVERIRSSEINFDIADNFAYSVLKLAASERAEKFNSDKKGYTLKDEAFKEIFGEVAGNAARIVRIDGATAAVAEYNNGKADTVRIINVGKTKIVLPRVD